MPISVKISLCAITRASKLFQRNYYLPLLRPLSPKDAARRKSITGTKFEHYIPCLAKYQEKMRDKKNRKGAPIIKKRVKRKDNEKYVTPFFDDNMDNHSLLESMLASKGKAKDHFYIYEIPDKGCTLVLSNLFEKAIKDKDILDIVIAQRSEKIVVKLKNGKKVSLPLAKFTDEGVFYRGSGYTKTAIEEYHHHGRETFNMARLFEAKEAGVEDWELEMMRLSSKRKKKVKGEDSGDFKLVMQAAAENMNWDQFEEDSKQIIEDADSYADEENIPMAVDSMEKTRNVNQKLKDGGDEVMEQLPLMKELPQVVKQLENGVLTELENVSGMEVLLEGGRVVFVPGQMVTHESGEVFMAGQTVQNEDGSDEYIPGMTVLEDGEPTLIPGLVFGEEEQPPMFLPGDSTITEDGQLQFEATDEDLPPREPTPEPTPPRTPTPEPVREPTPELKPLPPRKDPLLAYEERRKLAEELERKRARERNEMKSLKAEKEIDDIRMKIRQKLRNFKIEQTPAYIPQPPVLKSKKLEALERSVDDGSFEDFTTKMILEKVRCESRKAKHDMLMGTVPAEEFGSNYEHGIGHYPNI